ncbi:hypothetical protein L1887_55757 [Cichorium endivia]|nr:hypothetical protein L1887_55757 [Cichorium endivia]
MMPDPHLTPKVQAATQGKGMLDQYPCEHPRTCAQERRVQDGEQYGAHVAKHARAGGQTARGARGSGTPIAREPLGARQKRSLHHQRGAPDGVRNLPPSKPRNTSRLPPRLHPRIAQSRIQNISWPRSHTRQIQTHWRCADRQSPYRSVWLCTACSSGLPLCMRQPESHFPLDLLLRLNGFFFLRAFGCAVYSMLCCSMTSSILSTARTSCVASSSCWRLDTSGIKDAAVLHVVVARAHAVDAELGVALGDLSALDLGERLDGRVARVLGQRERDRVERRCKRAHRVLLQRRNLVGRLGNRHARTDLGRTSTVHHAVVYNKVAHHADGIVQRTLRLVDDHLVRAADKDGDGARVGALLDDEACGRVSCRSPPRAPRRPGRASRATDPQSAARCGRWWQSR